MKTARQEVEFSLFLWDESRASYFGHKDEQRSWKPDDQQLELASVFPPSVSYHVPLKKPNVLQNKPNKQPCRKVHHSARNVCRALKTKKLAGKTLG